MKDTLSHQTKPLLYSLWLAYELTVETSLFAAIASDRPCPQNNARDYSFQFWKPTFGLYDQRKKMIAKCKLINIICEGCKLEEDWVAIN